MRHHPVACRAFVRASSNFCKTALLIGILALNLCAARSDDHLVANGPRASYWKTLFSKFPKSWKSGRTLVVREVSDREMDRLVAQTENGDDQDKNDDSIVEGFYDRGKRDSDPDSITLRLSLRSEEAGFVFTHEYGHMIWDEILTRSDRREYDRIWSSQRRHRSLVTEYAADSVEEGFAEAIAAYIRTPEKLKRRDMDSWQFVDDLAHLNPDPEPQEAPHGKQ
jgi:hypothetical protein